MEVGRGGGREGGGKKECAISVGASERANVQFCGGWTSFQRQEIALIALVLVALDRIGYMIIGYMIIG